MHRIALFKRILDRVKAHQLLQENEKYYHELFDRAPFGYFRSTIEGQIISINSKMASIHAYDSPEEMITTVSGRGINSLYENAEDRKKVLQKTVEAHG